MVSKNTPLNHPQEAPRRSIDTLPEPGSWERQNLQPGLGRIQVGYTIKKRQRKQYSGLPFARFGK